MPANTYSKLTPIHASKFGGQGVADLALSPQGRTVAVTNNNKTIGLYELESGKKIWSVKDHEGTPHEIAFSPDGQQIATATELKVDRKRAGCEVVLRKASDGGITGRIAFKQVKEEDPAQLGYSPDGTFLVCSLFHDDGSRIAIIDPKASKLAGIIGETEDIFHTFALDDKRVYTFIDGSLQTWTLAGRKMEKKVEYKGTRIDAPTLAPDGKTVVIHDSREGAVLFVDPKSGKTAHKIPKVRKDSKVDRLRFSRDGKQLFALTSDGAFSAYDAKSGKELANHTKHRPTGATDRSDDTDFDPATGLLVQAGTKLWVSRIE